MARLGGDAVWYRAVAYDVSEGGDKLVAECTLFQPHRRSCPA
jgi:hypothetical protein